MEQKKSKFEIITKDAVDTTILSAIPKPIGSSINITTDSVPGRGRSYA